MNKTSKRSRFFVFVAACSVAVIGSAAQIEPPKVPVVDKNGVNLANGQVTHSQFTVAIGGATGLSHSVSVHANEFRGFEGKYKGAGSNVELSLQLDYAPRNIYRVYDWDETVDFAYMLGNANGSNMQMQQGGSNICAPFNQTFKYQSLGDERHTLECDSTYLYWTKPDGTVVRFLRTGYTVDSYATLLDVTYPNGFTISTVANGMSATTNTGFQVKSFYEDDHRDFRCSAPNPIQGCKNDITTLINTDPYFTSYASGWSNANARYVKAINNAVEYCPPSARDCVLSKKWPTATFKWAAGMPRTLSIGETEVSMIDMKGQTTWVKFKAYDLAYETYQGGVIAQGKVLNKEMSPRIVRIHSDGNDRDFTYDYENVYVTEGADSTWDVRLQTSGKIVWSKLMGNAQTGYSIAQPFQNDAVSQAYGIGGIQRVQIKGSAIQGNPGAIYFVEADEGTLWRESTSTRNFPIQFVPDIGPPQSFEYTRSNLAKIVYRKNMSDMTYVQAFFPPSCTPATRKTCNHASSVRDARGNVTDYTYHEPSGGLYTVTLPADKNGRRAQTRYEYEQRSAHYFNGGAGKITGSPIWMKVSERYCINSNYADSTPGDGNPLNGACAGSDEVVTRYEYNHDNLLMTGMTVTSPAPNSETLRTCFRYDIYGNQIGKTEPNANLSSCP